MYICNKGLFYGMILFKEKCFKIISVKYDIRRSNTNNKSYVIFDTISRIVYYKWI